MKTKLAIIAAAALASHIQAGHDWNFERGARHLPDAVLFEHAYRRGEALVLGIGDAIPNLDRLPMRYGSWNDVVSSIRLAPRTAIILYEHAGFRGRSARIGRSINDLAYVDGYRPEEDWNDRVSSLRVIGDRGSKGPGHRPPRDDLDSPRGRPDEARHRGGRRGKPLAVVFEPASFRGNALRLFEGQSIPNLDPVPGHWNDSISSIQLDPGVILELYEHAGFRGRKIVFERSQHNLAYPKIEGGFRHRRISWNDRISSIRVTSR